MRKRKVYYGSINKPIVIRPLQIPPESELNLLDRPSTAYLHHASNMPRYHVLYVVSESDEKESPVVYV